jgi:hypothetical protein
MDDEVEVIAHDLKSGQTTPVDIDVEQHHVQEFAPGLVVFKGEPIGSASDSIGEVIEGGFCAFVSCGSGHGHCPRFTGLGLGGESVRTPDDNNDSELRKAKETQENQQISRFRKQPRKLDQVATSVVFAGEGADTFVVCPVPPVPAKQTVPF